MPWLALLLVLASCGTGQPAYVGARPLTDDKAHPRFRELTALLGKPGDHNPDALLRVFRDYIADNRMPLHQDTAATFFYYDWTHNLSQVFLEASFAPERQERLTRLGTTGLFFRTYEVARLDRVKYRFTDGTQGLPDPFNPTITAEPGFWHAEQDPTLPERQWVVGASEDALGQDLELVLPAGYSRNLMQTYPWMVVVGASEGWADAWLQAGMDSVVFVAVAAPSVGWTTGLLKSQVEEKVVPWVRAHYRVGADSRSLALVGLASAAKPAQDAAAARPDLWSRALTSLDPALLKPQATVATP